MRIAILSAILLLSSIVAFGARAETVTVDIGQSKVSKTGKITVRFDTVVEDSRCPEGTACVWAGNAKVKITVSKGRRTARVFELNSTMGEKSVTFQGYDIAFVDLAPHRTMSKVAVRSQQLTVSIVKHKGA